MTYNPKQPRTPKGGPGAGRWTTVTLPIENLTYRQITERVQAAIEQLHITDAGSECEFEYYGLRYEFKARRIGDSIPASRDNPDRSDERDFPAYGTSAYWRLPKLDGVSAWRISGYAPDIEWQKSYTTFLNSADSDEMYNYATHCYVIAGNDPGAHPNPDRNEILIRDARVVAIIF